MKIVIPGGSGQVGSLLARNFHQRGDEVIVLSRMPDKRPWRMVQWDGETLGAWAGELDGADLVINMTGRNVNCRYNAKNRKLIKQSRIQSTQVVGQAIARAKHPPQVWLQASTSTIYAHRYDAGNDEATGTLGGSERGVPDTWRFSFDVADSWERELDEAAVPRTRKVKLRSSMTMSPDAGGVFDVLLRLVRFGLGGQAGNGRQYVSWIHGDDFIRAIDWIVQHGHIEGSINLTAPNPLPNADFMRELRSAWGMPIGLPAAKWMLEIGARIIRTETELILKSRRVVPGRLLQEGFSFRFPTWAEAAHDLCGQWRKRV